MSACVQSCRRAGGQMTTRDEVLAMARDAGATVDFHEQTICFFTYDGSFERFHALAVAKTLQSIKDAELPVEPPETMSLASL